MNRLLLFALMLMLLTALPACTAQPSQDGDPVGDERSPAGFWQGLWHGFIAPFTFIASLFTKSVGVYEAYNNGGWYNFGFIFGLMVFFGGGNRAGRRAWQKRLQAGPMHEKEQQ